MESVKTTAHKPMILATCVMAGIGIGLLGHMMFGGGTAEGSESCAALDVAGLNKMVNEHANSINAGQAMATVAQYHPEMVGINSRDDDWITSRDAALVAMNDFLKDKPTAQYTPQTQFIGCNIAYSIGHRETDWTDPDTKAKMHRQTRYTMIFRHGENGWKIAHMHFSLPVDITATATPAAASK